MSLPNKANLLALGLPPALANELEAQLAGGGVAGGAAALPSSPAGNGTGAIKDAGLLYTTTATVATGTGTAEQTLATYSLPANSLDSVGRRLKVRAVLATGATANNKTAKLYFGAAVITTPTAATNAKNIVLELEVVKTGASTQIVTGSGIVDVTPVTPYYAAGAETDTAAIVIKATGTDGTSAAADLTLVDFRIEFLN